MINFFLNFSLFILIYIFGFLSVSGFGKLFIKKNNINYNHNNFFDLQIFGTIILLVISYLIYLTIGTNHIINIFILFLGLLIYFFYKKELNKVKVVYLLALLLLILPVLLISKTHEDFNNYHLFSIYEVFNNNLRIGVSNLNDKFFHSSLLIHNQSLFVFPYLNFRMVHLPVIYIYASSLGYFLYLIFLNRNSNEVLYSIFCLLILMIKFNRLSEFGYDYISQFLLLIAFHKIYFLISNDDEIIISIIIFLFSALIKPVALLFLPLFFYILFNKKYNFYIYLIKSRILIILTLLTILISSSFFKTGCIFYPANFTCFNKEQLFWSEKDIVKNYSEMVSLWAKAYYKQDESKYTKIEDKNLYNKNFNWFKYWIEKHFFYKIFEFIIIIFLSFIIIYIYFTKHKSEIDKKHNQKYIFLILCALSIFFWLITVPQFRFGFASVLLFLFIFLRIIFKKKILFNKKKFFILFFLSLLVLNIKNVNRISSEIQRNDFYKYNNFPYFNEIEIINSYKNLDRISILHIEILK